MIVYNTLTREREELKTIDENQVRIYSCGPTVYNFAHIGNLRTYVFMDLLRRVLKLNGYALNHVMNITDVGHLVSDEDEGEDKMVLGAREQGKTPWEIAQDYTQAFLRDIARLNIGEPEHVCKATEHIPEMIAFVQGLVERGFGYETSDGVYFDIGRFSGYGKLSRLNLEEQLAGARVEVNAEKRHPADFALWKKAPKEHIMQWDSPWGMGYPGWHIECSAMSRKYLGDCFDIHTGGVDHIPVHHENEIAQSEALLGHPAVNTWMHGEFMMVNNGKMSKSLKNNYTVADLEQKGYLPLAFRYFCLNAHYRNKLNFTWESMDAAQTAYLRLLEASVAHQNGAAPDEAAMQEAQAALAQFEQAVNDDLNVPKALGIAWTLAGRRDKSQSVHEALLRMDRILGLDLDRAKAILDHQRKETAVEAVPQDIQALLDQRAQAREDKNWAESDRIRDALREQGYILVDTKEGQKLRKE